MRTFVLFPLFEINSSAQPPYLPAYLPTCLPVCLPLRTTFMQQTHLRTREEFCCRPKERKKERKKEYRRNSGVYLLIFRCGIIQ